VSTVTLRGGKRSTLWRSLVSGRLWDPTWRPGADRTGRGRWAWRMSRDTRIGQQLAQPPAGLLATSQVSCGRSVRRPPSRGNRASRRRALSPSGRPLSRRSQWRRRERPTAHTRAMALPHGLDRRFCEVMAAKAAASQDRLGWLPAKQEAWTARPRQRHVGQARINAPRASGLYRLSEAIGPPSSSA
jgi:hypothetical protein